MKGRCRFREFGRSAGKEKLNSRTVFEFAVDSQKSIVSLHDVLHDGEPEPGASKFA